MQSTSNTKAFIHKEQYGGKKKMKHPMTAAAKTAAKVGAKAAGMGAKKKPMGTTKPAAKGAAAMAGKATAKRKVTSGMKKKGY